MIEGGHAIFSIKDDSSSVDCAAYEPTGEFRDIVMKLRTDDEVLAFAGVRPASSSHGLTLNLEGLEVLEVSKQVESSNPICVKCGKRMKSAGSEKGFKCVKCGFKNRDATKIDRVVKRDLRKGLYLPPPRAQRHLTRPFARNGKENSGVPKALITKWHSH
jgi:tRNA(Ile2)-agmatinylcytidine synthase